MEDKPKVSLGMMLEILKDLEDLPPEQFDPAMLLGDISDKVDGIKWRMDNWRATAAMIEKEYIAPLERKVASLLKKRDMLEDYVRSEMIRLDRKTIQGKMCRVHLQNSNPSVG